MKILVVTQGNVDHSSSRIRALQYISYLKSEGYEVKWLPRIPKKSGKSKRDQLWFAIKKRINLIRIFLTILSCRFQVLFIQRFFVSNWLLGYCKKKGKTIIYDFDDAIYISEIDKRAEEKTISILKNADLVISSCPVLNEYSKKVNANSIIITSAVDADSIFPQNERNSLVTIGWIGSEWTSKYLSMLEPIINKLSERYKFQLLLVGAVDGVNFNIKTKRLKWSLENENRYLNMIDIGIMPLFDNKFEQAKGGYKIFQYMAAGKPVLASPVGINKDIVHHGINGYLCESEMEWYSSFCNLLDNEDLRIKMGNRGREMVLEKYCLNVCASEFIRSIKNCINEHGN